MFFVLEKLFWKKHKPRKRINISRHTAVPRRRVVLYVGAQTYNEAVLRRVYGPPDWQYDDLPHFIRQFESRMLQSGHAAKQ